MKPNGKDVYGCFLVLWAIFCGINVQFYNSNTQQDMVLAK